MSDSKLEQKFKDKLDGHISPIDTDSLWSDIQEKQDGPANPNKWIYTSLFLLIGIVVICFLYTNSNNSKINNTDLSKTGFTENNNEHITESIKANSSTTKNDLPLSDQALSLDQKNKNNVAEQKTDLTYKSNQQINLSNETVNVGGGTKTNNATDQSNNAFLSNIANAQRSSSKRVLDKISSDNKRRIPIENLGDSTNPKAPNNSKIKEINNSDKSKNENSSLDASSNSNNINEGPSKIYTETNTKTNSIKSIIRFEDLLLNNLPIPLLSYDFDTPKAKEIDPLKNRKNSTFEIGTFFNYDLVKRKISSPSQDSFDVLYAKLRDDSEKFIESYQTGIFGRKNLKKGFRLSLGLGYGQLTERFDTDIIVDEFTILDSTTNFVEKIRTLTRSRKIHNRYRTFNVPLTIGRSFKSGPLSLNLDLGAMWTYRISNTGQVHTDYNAGEEFLKLEETTEELIKQEEHYFSWLAYAGLAYEFRNKLSVEFGPQIHSSFKSKLHEYRIDTKRHFIGLKCSLIKKF